ncbi:MAG: AAA family ATPase [Chloroflexota bacterium]
MTAIPEAFEAIAPPLAGSTPGSGVPTLPEVPLDAIVADSSRVRGTSVRHDSGVGVLLVEDVARVSEHIAEMLEGDPHVRLLETVSDGGVALDRIRELQPDVLIVDALLQGRVNGLVVAKRVRDEGIDIPMIMTTVPDRPLKPPAGMGAIEILTLPFDGTDLLATITRLDDRHRGSAPLRATGSFVVYSGKGGVGSTTIAYNLAVTLGQVPGARVALVDGDLQYGDLRLLLEVPDSAPSMMQLPTGHITEADLVPVLWRDPSGIDVLLAPPRLEQADMITLAEVENVLGLLRRLYDVVVIDAPSTMDEMTLALLDGADAMLSIVTPERGAVRKTVRCRQVLSAAGYPMEKIVTVLNRCDATGLSREAICAELGHEPQALLPDEPRFATAGDASGQAMVAGHPESSISRGIADLARILAERGRTGVGSPGALPA